MFFLWGFAAVSAVSSQAWEQSKHKTTATGFDPTSWSIIATATTAQKLGRKWCPRGDAVWPSRAPKTIGRGGVYWKKGKKTNNGTLGFLGALNVNKPIQNEQKRCHVEWLPWSKPASGSTHVPRGNEDLLIQKNYYKCQWTTPVLQRTH